MLIGTLDEVEFAPEYPELVGKRVLVTGVAGALGIDVVRAFAEARARLVVQADEDGPETQAMAELIAPHAMDVKLFPGGLHGADAMLRFAREAAQSFGGLDVVINLARPGEPHVDADDGDVEGMVADTLAMPVLATRVAINRMRTMLCPGIVLNIVSSPRGAAPAADMLAVIARHALASFTRSEAEAATDAGIRVNAIVPAAGPVGPEKMLSGSADVATLALHLASGRGPDLTGLVFEAWCG
ncbi:MAG: SDR family NAD(P)-dependent oxidoreductase [Hyphomicrobiaceae bacterium]